MRGLFLLMSLIFLVSACTERPSNIENKLSLYLQDDLKFMVAETMKASNDRSAVLDSPYYKIRDLRFFDKAHSKMYSAYAVVDFFVYRDIKMYERRKYRYNSDYWFWDRYYKAWLFGADVENKK